ncbi:hypothetical protein [Streptococcus mutans]|uniref:hypothetical protein n=1 Tax=Streptococcus mutans TaxID=1309 RepID=UPI001EE9CEBE|nr:hypothetical protein [Streptococcus mutans]
MALSACGLTKNSRTWIEKKRVADIYKVYPTKNPKDLFKVFPDGFTLGQFYTNKKGEMYKINFVGDPKTKIIKGELIKDPTGGKEKVSDVIYQNNHLVFSDPTVKKYWPLDGFLFQHLTLNQAYIDGLKEKDHSYNFQNGSFSVSYELKNSRVGKLLNLENEKITNFEIMGNGKDYQGRTLIFTFDNGIDFSEGIHKIKK